MTVLSALFPSVGGKSKDFVASGAVTAATPVILNSAGTVTEVGFATTAESIPAGAEDVVGVLINYVGLAVDPTSGNVVAVYKDFDASPSDYGWCVVGVVSGTTLTWGTPTAFSSAAMAAAPLSVNFDPNTAGSFVIGYRTTALNVIRVIASTLSGSTLGAFGTGVAFASSASPADTANNQLSFDPNTAGKFAMANVITSAATSGIVIGTVSGTTVSFAGSTQDFTTADDYAYGNVIWNPNVANEIVASFVRSGWWGKVIKGTVSGTSVTWGTETILVSATANYLNLQFDPNVANSFAWAYYNANTGVGGSGAGTLVGATWTFGTNQVVPSGGSGQNFMVRFDPNQAGKLACIYASSDGAYNVRATSATISGTTLTWGTQNELSADGDYAAGPGMEAISFSTTEKGKFVAGYALGSASSNAMGGVVGQIEASVTNLTATNLVGIAAEAISDTATGSVNLRGAISDGFTSLVEGSEYYVQADGTVTTTSTSPAQKLGVALSETQINTEYLT